MTWEDSYDLAEEIQALEKFLHGGVQATRANLAWERIKKHVREGEYVKAGKWEEVQ